MPPPNISFPSGAQTQLTAAPSITTTATTTTQPSPNSPARTPFPAPLILRLRAPSVTASSRRIRWAEDVVDNEGLGRKKSKVCCIYHGPHEPGDSSDSSSSDSDSNSDSVLDSGNDDGRARMARSTQGGKSDKRRGQDPEHEHGKEENGNGCHYHGGGSSGNQARARQPRRQGRNAYEKIPKRRDAQ